VAAGGLVEVALLGTSGRSWQPIQLSGSALKPLSNPAAAATRGTQLGEYCAASRGAATLSSTDGRIEWTVTVDVT
jgi:hypothetical protein